MSQTDPSELLNRFIDCVTDIEVSVENKAEAVINLAKAWDLDDEPLRHALQKRMGPEAVDHPYFHWRPRPRFMVGDGVRVVDGAPQALGRKGRVTAIDDPRRLGARGMSRAHFFTVVLDDSPEPWGFREEQLEEAKL